VTIVFKTSFLRDLESIKDRRLLDRIKAAIENIELAGSLAEISNLKPLRGSKNYFRIRIGDYRIGLVVEKSSDTICEMSAPQRNL
jgi:mRNA interferase RelE/StbE